MPVMRTYFSDTQKSVAGSYLGSEEAPSASISLNLKKERLHIASVHQTYIIVHKVNSEEYGQEDLLSHRRHRSLSFIRTQLLKNN